MATFYAVRFIENTNSEFQKFYDSFAAKPLHNVDMHLIAYWMGKIGAEGTLEEYFREEGRIYLKALPIDSAMLRLYCYKIQQSILLFAGGGLKQVRTYQEDPVLNFNAHLARTVGNKILRYIKLGKITVTDNKLEGRLCFDIDLKV